MLNSTRSALKSRGVYELPFLTTADERVLVAVNGRGQRVAERIVPLGADLHVEWVALSSDLDRLDPRPQLRIV